MFIMCCCVLVSGYGFFKLDAKTMSKRGVVSWNISGPPALLKPAQPCLVQCT